VQGHRLINQSSPAGDFAEVREGDGHAGTVVVTPVDLQALAVELRRPVEVTVVISDHSKASERSGSPDLVAETLEDSETFTQALPGQGEVAALASHPSGSVEGGRRALARRAHGAVAAGDDLPAGRQDRQSPAGAATRPSR